MTAPDPRLGEIAARLSAATPGPWDFDGNEITNAPDYASEQPAPWTQVMECEVSCGSYCYGGSLKLIISPENRALIQNAPADVAHLLAELRTAREALARVEGLCGSWQAMATTTNTADTTLRATVYALRAAVAAATGGGEK